MNPVIKPLDDTVAMVKIWEKAILQDFLLTEFYCVQKHLKIIKCKHVLTVDSLEVFHVTFVFRL